MPIVSIIMPAYNAEAYIAESIKSILKQTFADFEFLILDDASNDSSAAIINSFNDHRIVYIRNDRNMGVARTLNKGMELAKGTYIARMDADDLSAPDRLARQVEFMERHSQIGISGGLVRLFGIGLPTTARVPTTPEEVAAYMYFENPLWHMSVIMRRESLERHELRYDPVFSRSEDYELWIRAVRHFPIANINNILVKVREHGKSATRANWDQVTAQTEKIQEGLLTREGYPVTREEIAFHHRVGRGYRMNSREEIKRAEAWLLQMCGTNRSLRKIPDASFQRGVAMVWFRVCANSGPLGPWVFQKWINSPLASCRNQSIVDLSRFVASIMWHRCRRLMPQQKKTNGQLSL